MSSVSDEWTLDDVFVRYADISDRQKVLDIRDVFNGYDYLAARYREYCHCEGYIMYLAEFRGRVVGYHHISLSDDTPGHEIIHEGGGRVVEHLEGMGVIGKIQQFMYDDVIRRFPNVRILGSYTITERWTDLVSKGVWRDQQKWKGIQYVVTRKEMDAFVRNQKKEPKNCCLQVIKPSSASQFIQKYFDAIQELIGTYGEYIIHETNWSPRKVTMKNLKEICLKHDVAVTLDDKGKLLALSILYHVSGKRGTNSSVHFYGMSTEHIYGHVHQHVCEETRCNKLEQNFMVGIFVPINFNTDKIKHTLDRGFGPNCEIIIFDCALSESLKW